MSSSRSNNEQMWKSKLGTHYPMDFMKANESKFNHQLQVLRQANPDCADCGAKRCTMWASVNLGVFLCISCGSHHRSLGTHISKPKGCTGTYWWGPDELDNMRVIGNERARQIYGDVIPEGLSPTSNPMAWRQYLTDKYLHKKYAPANRALPSVSKGPSVDKVDESPDLMSFEEREDLFANFRDWSESPAIRNPPTLAQTADLLGLHGDETEATKKKEDVHKTSNRYPTSRTKVDPANKDFFAEFGL